MVLAEQKRTETIEQLAEVDEEIREIFLVNETLSNDQIAAAIRRATIILKFSPLFPGSAIKSTCAQPLLCAYLPNPAQAETVAYDSSSSPSVPLSPAANAVVTWTCVQTGRAAWPTNIYT